MKVVAYCRVSTNKEEQLDSLESQQKFFGEYAKRNSYDLIHIYADEGKSGTKIKNRTQLLKLLEDGEKGCFEMVLIKDISRLARNTVDFLTSIRSLKALNIRVVFVNYDQTSSDSSEFMLTMLSAIAQEESANTSKRVRFGKKQNASKGRVPNLVFGYDKIPGEYFSLDINLEEAEVVKKIFKMYTKEKIGTAKIATYLNEEGIKTKRGCDWSQIAISRILRNEIYIGEIVNGKEEIEDFLTGKRKEMEQNNWMIVKCPELRIIEDITFQKAKEIMKSRQNAFVNAGKRITTKHLFSHMLKCSHCGSSFRRLVRSYKNTHISWVCNGRNGKGSSYCCNTTAIDETQLIEAINNYMETVLRSCPLVVLQVARNYKRYKRRTDKKHGNIKICLDTLDKLKKDKQKYIELYTNEIITLEELKITVDKLNKEIENSLLKLAIFREEEQNPINSMDKKVVFEHMEKMLRSKTLVDGVMNKLIKKIEVDREGNVDIFLELYE